MLQNLIHRDSYKCNSTVLVKAEYTLHIAQMSFMYWNLPK